MHPLIIKRKLVNGFRELRLFASNRQLRRIQFCSGLGGAAHLLYGLTRSMKPDVCVEIGSARGKSTCHIGMALKENGHGKLYAIDPHRSTKWNDPYSVDTFGIITQNLKNVGVVEQVEIVRKTSDCAAQNWSKKIDILFVDGDHSYEGVKSDWDLFSPHLREFGIVIFHDTLWDLRPDPRNPGWTEMGVPRFVNDLRLQGYPVLTVDKDFGVSLVQATKGGVPLSAGTNTEVSRSQGRT
jgi:predicted O-methyltransferase YrrM